MKCAANHCRQWMGCCAFALALLVANSATAQLVDVVPLDDFENVTLEPFGPAFRPADPGCDGTDYSTTFGNWVIEINHLNGFECAEPAYNSWAIMDVDSWNAEQGGQARDFSGLLGVGTNNTILVADPDAADDFPSSGDADPANYNSCVYCDFDIANADKSSLTLSLDYEFRCEDLQTGTIEVSFDGGAASQLLFIDSTNCPNEFESGSPVYDLSSIAPANAQSMRVKFICTGGNDWWFAIDNVSIDDTNGNVAADDFESYGPLEAFTVATCPSSPQVGDGTDWSNMIPDWKIDNSGMLAGCEEGAFNGWAAIDADMWVLEQGGQGRENKFNLFVPNNTIMCADPDAYYDFPPEGGQPEKAFNSYVCREYDIKTFDPTTLAVSMQWQFRVEDCQRGLIQVKFDDGEWQTLLDLDSDDGTWAGGELLDEETAGQTGTWTYGAGDFEGCGTKMTLRVCCIDGGNDWWFAFDNVQIQAEELGFTRGDVTGDGNLTNADIPGFVLALINPTQFAMDFPNVNPDDVFDFNCDGFFSNADIPGFTFALLGG